MTKLSTQRRALLVIARPTSIDQAAAAKVISDLEFEPLFADDVAKAGRSYLGDHIAGGVIIPPLNDVFQALAVARRLFLRSPFVVPLGAPRSPHLPARLLWSGGTAAVREDVTNVVEAVVALWLKTRSEEADAPDEWDVPTLDALMPPLAHVEEASMSADSDFSETITQTFSFFPPAIGDPCPRCTEPLVRRRNAFLDRSGYEDGAYCPSCKRAWAIRGEEGDTGEESDLGRESPGEGA